MQNEDKNPFHTDSGATQTKPPDTQFASNTSTKRKPKKKRIVNLPVARIKRIVNQDDSVVAISTPAVYAVAAATELFISCFAGQANVQALIEKRKKMNYKDFSNAVEQTSSLQFLSRLIPQSHKLYKLVNKGLVARPYALKSQVSLGSFIPAGTTQGSNLTSGTETTTTNLAQLKQTSTSGFEEKAEPEAAEFVGENESVQNTITIEQVDEGSGVDLKSVYKAWAMKIDIIADAPPAIRRKSDLELVLNEEDVSMEDTSNDNEKK